MKTTIIADSSGLISLASATDQNHKKALKISKQLSSISGTIIIPSDVFSETLNIAEKKLGHKAANTTANIIFSSDSFVILNTDEKLLKKALVFFQKQPESVSYTDCIVMTIADRYETKQIFGFDLAFHKNGYIRLGID